MHGLDDIGKDLRVRFAAVFGLSGHDNVYHHFNIKLDFLLVSVKILVLALSSISTFLAKVLERPPFSNILKNGTKGCDVISIALTPILNKSTS